MLTTDSFHSLRPSHTDVFLQQRYGSQTRSSSLAPSLFQSLSFSACYQIKIKMESFSSSPERLLQTSLSDEACFFPSGAT